jgi:hypothetical protein
VSARRLSIHEFYSINFAEYSAARICVAHLQEDFIIKRHQMVSRRLQTNQNQNYDKNAPQNGLPNPIC